MTNQYNYKWKWFTLSVFLWTALFVYFTYWSTSLGSNGIFVPFIMIPLSLFMMLNDISQVTLTDTHFHIRYTLPFKRSHTISLDEVMAYNELHEGLFGINTPSGGRITPLEGAQILIKSAGIDNFKELNEKLSHRFPSLPLNQ